MTFCSPACWDGHLGAARHREAYAEEQHSPSKMDFIRAQAEEVGADMSEKRKIFRFEDQSNTAQNNIGSAKDHSEVDTLVVVSKVKAFIREQSEMNTSQCAIDALTDVVVSACMNGIRKASAAGRKTVMGRDIEN